MALKQKGRQLLINTPLGEDFLLLEELFASETISELFSFQLKLVHEETANNLTPTVVDPKKILGEPMGIQIKMPDKTSRYFNGVVSHWRQGNRDTRFTYYNAVVVPKVWTLTQKSQSRIFQRLTIQEILKQVFAGFDVVDELVGNFSRREYCVQYQETDFAFASRLMEEEGIYYYFEHTADKHNMILANTPLSHRACKPQSKFPFEADVTRQNGSVGSVNTWETAYQLQTGKVTVWDHNFELPHRHLEADEPSLYPVAGNSALEIFQYPGAYAKRYTGIDPTGGDQSGELQHIFEDNQYQAEIQMQAIDAKYKVALGTSNCCPLTVGHKFDIFNHPAKGTDGQYVLTQVTHHAHQSPSLSTEEKVELPYQNSFNCIPLKTGSTPFRPVRKTPKSIVNGSQTAVVVGPPGEEIFTDKYGRIKVQFHWDRQGGYDVGSSCWIRVSQGWAGHNWGSIAVPRIGQEVIVEFLEGDPDHPIVTGSVYNPQQMPPYALPDEKTKTTTKSMSSPGGGGFNELRFEDKKGQEQVFVHAEKDLDIQVENISREEVGKDKHLIVQNDYLEKIFADKHLEVLGDKNEKVGGTVSLTAGQNLQERVGEKYALAAGLEVHLLAGLNMVIEAGGSLTLKVGASSINITPGGIFSTPPILPGGVPMIGSGSQPQMPKSPDEADNAKPGTVSNNYQANAMKTAAQNGLPFCEICTK